MLDHGDEDENFLPPHIIWTRKMMARLKSGRIGGLGRLGKLEGSTKSLAVGCGVGLMALFLILSLSGSKPHAPSNAVAPMKAASLLPSPEIKPQGVSMLERLKEEAKIHKKRRQKR